MGKRLVLATVALVLASVGAAALQIGVGGILSVGVAGGVPSIGAVNGSLAGGIDLRAWPYPLQLGVGLWSIPNVGVMTLGFNADYWIRSGRFGSLPFGGYVGAGLWFSAPVLVVGARLPFGLLWWPLKDHPSLEAHIDILPEVGAMLAPGPLLVWSLRAGLGVRWWFGR